MNFSAFVLFELWDSPPADSSLLNHYNGPTVRVLLNPTPFKNSDGTASRTVQTSAMIVLKDYTLNEIANTLQHLRSVTSNLYMKPVKKEKETSAESHPVVTDSVAAPVATTSGTEQETEIDMLS